MPSNGPPPLLSYPHHQNTPPTPTPTLQTILGDPKTVKDRVMCIQALSFRWPVSLTAARARQSKCCRIPACNMCKRNRIPEIPI
ncbi:hypothetical protein A9Z42_0066760 [Trichoderma parareesei]|uniref:Uncharacterized protein n=1 Tax=Trichoderma parareesei TaxID=858221 RepID=A0A2H2ZG26_TRIPA|nr:hypothetical protein A9Z42_0066760 [Trichoderma parareesei]